MSQDTSQQQGTAVQIAQGTSAAGARWKAYRLSPPLEGNEHVRVSAVDLSETPFVSDIAVFLPGAGIETYIFPADERGEVTDWGELPGSYRGGLDHAKALAGAGYSIGDAS